MARPTKLTDEVEERILKAIRIGNHITVAAQYAGIHPATFYRWMNGDPDASDKRNLRYRRFRERVAQARAEAEVRHVSLIAKAGERQWRAAAFLLERGSPERWGKASLSPAGTQQGTASEPPSAPGWPPGFHHSRLSAEEQEQLLELLNRGCDPDSGDSKAERAACSRPEHWVDPHEALWSSVLFERTLQDPALIGYSHRLLELEWKKEQGEDVDPDALDEEYVKAAGMPPRPWAGSSSGPDP